MSPLKVMLKNHNNRRHAKTANFEWQYVEICNQRGNFSTKVGGRGREFSISNSSNVSMYMYKMWFKGASHEVKNLNKWHLF